MVHQLPARQALDHDWTIGAPGVGVGEAPHSCGAHDVLPHLHRVGAARLRER